MRNAVLGCIVCAGLVVATFVASRQFSPVYAQRPTAPPASGQLMALSADVEGGQIVTLVDPGARVMSIYRIDGATGEVRLTSVRNVHWDLQMDEFNGGSPSPREIRTLLHPR